MILQPPDAAPHKTRSSHARVLNQAALQLWKEKGYVLPLQKYPRAVEIFRQGMSANGAYLLHSGIAKLNLVEEDGRELIFDIKFSGALIGTAAAFLQKEHPFSAVTLTECCLQYIPAQTMRAILETDNALSSYIHSAHCFEIYEHAARISTLVCLTARQRFEQLICRLARALGAQRSERELKLRLPLKYWEVAELLAITPEHLSRLIRQMQREGILRLQKGCLILSDIDHLNFPHED
jgi:CRP/FNR family cyclic AMP-dependent transcriptional regulator